MARQASGQTDYTPLIMLGGIYLIINKLLPGDDKQTKDENKATTEIETKPIRGNPFEAGFIPPMKELPKGMVLSTLGTADLQKIVKHIEGGIGYIWDNEAQIFGGIKKARTTTDLWHIGRFYEKKFKEDMYMSLKQNLSKKELGKVNAFVKKLPDWVPA